MADIKKQTQKICTAITEKVSSEEIKPFTYQTASFGQCPICGGNVIKTKWGYGCSNYKEKGCKFTLSKEICGKKLTETNIKNLLTKGKSGKINGFISNIFKFICLLQMIL